MRLDISSSRRPGADRARLIRVAASRHLLAGLLTCAAGIASATEPGTPAPSVSLHGFGTLGLTRAHGGAEYIRDLSQPDGAGSSWSAKVDSLLGLQANVELSPRTEAVAQVVSRHRYDGGYRPELTWAFLRHDFSPDFSLRAGRLGTEFYMLGDSRLVGYANTSIRPPPDFYGSLVFSYIDGIDAAMTWPAGSGLLRGKLFAGKSPEQAPFAAGIAWNLRGSPLIGGHLEYLDGNWQIRFSHASVRFDKETPTDALLRALGDPLGGVPYLSLVPEMAMADTWARFNALGLVYDQGPLRIEWMLNRIDQEGPAYADSRAGYLLASYRLGEITPYLGISRSYTPTSRLPSSPIPGLDAITASLVGQSRIDQRTVTLGGRWDFHKNLALKAQIDRVEGKPSSLFLVKHPAADWDGNLTVYSLALDFVF